jgi:hypothetical protein
MSTIIEIGDALRANPKSWKQLHYTKRNSLIEALRPNRLHGFDGQQAAWIYSWVLLVTPDQLAELQSLHPRQYAGREDKDGKLYLSAALLTDALEGRRLSAAEPILTSLTMYHVADLEWPEPEETDL